jgi:hypothetical protein
LGLWLGGLVRCVLLVLSWGVFVVVSCVLVAPRPSDVQVLEVGSGWVPGVAAVCGSCCRLQGACVLGCGRPCESTAAGDTHLPGPPRLYITVIALCGFW